MPKSCIILGGGIAGLSAGIAMRKAGYRVTLFEQAEDIRPLGAALSIWGNAMAGLDWLGCGERVRAESAPILEVSLSLANGPSLFGPVDVSHSDSYLPMRSILQSLLLEKLGSDQCRFGVRIDDTEQGADGVSVLADGKKLASADLLIVADGIHSRIAEDLLGNPAQFSGYVGALGLCTPSDGSVIAGNASELWKRGERFGLFDAGAGQRYWFYTRTAESAAEKDGLTREHLLECAQTWPEAVEQSLSATPVSDIIPIAIHAKAPPKQLGKGRIICIGDAAHAMEPNQGQGACQGIEDGWALGVLAGRCEPQEILAGFERLRLKRIRGKMRDSAMISRVVHASGRLGWSIGRRMIGAGPQWLDERQLLPRITPPTIG